MSAAEVGDVPHVGTQCVQNSRIPPGLEDYEEPGSPGLEEPEAPGRALGVQRVGVVEDDAGIRVGREEDEVVDGQDARELERLEDEKGVQKSGEWYDLSGFLPSHEKLVNSSVVFLLGRREKKDVTFYSVLSLGALDFFFLLSL